MFNLLSLLHEDRGPIPAFSSYTVQSSSTILEEYDTPNTWHGRPSIIAHKGNWVMAFVEAETHSTNGTQKIQIAFSNDLGLTWKSKNTYIDDSPVVGFERQGNGGVATCTADVQLINSPNGDILAVVTDSRSAPDPTYWADCSLNRSSDGGKTWGSWTSIANQFEGGGDNTWASLDHFVLGNTIYITRSYSLGGTVQTSAKSMVYKSVNYGVTWTKTGDISPTTDVTQEAGINVLPNGDFLAVVKTQMSGGTGANKYQSTNQGVDWTRLANINNSIGIHQPLLKRFDRENRIYVSGRHYQGANAKRSGFHYSDDLGATWTNYFIPNSSKTLNDGGYADLIKRSEDIFYLVCYEGELTNSSLWEYVIKGNI